MLHFSVLHLDVSGSEVIKNLCRFQIKVFIDFLLHGKCYDMFCRRHRDIQRCSSPVGTQNLVKMCWLMILCLSLSTLPFYVVFVMLALGYASHISVLPDASLIVLLTRSAREKWEAVFYSMLFSVLIPICQYHLFILAVELIPLSSFLSSLQNRSHCAPWEIAAVVRLCPSSWVWVPASCFLLWDVEIPAQLGSNFSKKG